MYIALDTDERASQQLSPAHLSQALAALQTD